jgi:hypothetical protein
MLAQHASFTFGNYFDVNYETAYVTVAHIMCAVELQNNYSSSAYQFQVEYSAGGMSPILQIQFCLLLLYNSHQLVGWPESDFGQTLHLHNLSRHTERCMKHRCRMRFAQR